MMFLSLLALLLIQAEKPAPVPGMPSPPGVYYRGGDSQWVKIEPAPVLDMKAKGVNTFIETNGYMNLNMTILYVGSHAPLQILEHRPTFYVRGAGPASEALIAQLASEKDRRMLQTVSSVASEGNKMGVKKKEIRSSTATIYADNSFSVVPDADLKPGEYILLFGNGNSSYAFGIKK